MSRPNLFHIDIWKNYENRIIEVLYLALKKLIFCNQLPTKEDDINRLFFIHLKRANHDLLQQGKGCVSIPFYEASNQPVELDTNRNSRESKIPDFQWGYSDRITGKDLMFTIECKRLGKSLSPSWNLLKNYVYNGINRFVDPNWAYGKGYESGAMIGYIQSMNHNDIFRTINNYNTQNGTSTLSKKSNWIIHGTSELSQNLTRNIQPSQFTLIHLWVDIRMFYEYE